MRTMTDEEVAGLSDEGLKHWKETLTSLQGKEESMHYGNDAKRVMNEARPSLDQINTEIERRKYSVK